MNRISSLLNITCKIAVMFHRLSWPWNIGGIKSQMQNVELTGPRILKRLSWWGCLQVDGSSWLYDYDNWQKILSLFSFASLVPSPRFLTQCRWLSSGSFSKNSTAKETTERSTRDGGSLAPCRSRSLCCYMSLHHLRLAASQEETLSVVSTSLPVLRPKKEGTSNLQMKAIL